MLIDVDALEDEKHNAFSAAIFAFDGLLESLVADLPQLRQISLEPAKVSSECAQRMIDATDELAGYGLTPMAAVAGAVSDHVMASMKMALPNKKMMVNNGGDIAVHLGSAPTCTIGIVPDVSRPSITSTVSLTPPSGVGGVATSGWRGRSHSLGIADSVTVLAASASDADALATLIGNHVNTAYENHSIKRERACDIDDDSDLGEHRVTVAVGALSQQSIDEALNNAEYFIDALPKHKKPISVCMALQGSYRVVGEIGHWSDELVAMSAAQAE